MFNISKYINVSVFLHTIKENMHMNECAIRNINDGLKPTTHMTHDRQTFTSKFLLVVMFRPEISSGQDVEGEDVGVYDGLIRLGCVSNATYSPINHN